MRASSIKSTCAYFTPRQIDGVQNGQDARSVDQSSVLMADYLNSLQPPNPNPTRIIPYHVIMTEGASVERAEAEHHPSALSDK